MSSWMKTLQSGANKVGNEAAKLKLYAEISLLKGDIKSLKEAWGVTCFDLYSQGDANGVNASHAKQLVKIREKESKVQAKIVELNKLKAPKEPVVVDSTPIAVPIAEVPPPTQTMAVPVPPDASAPACDSRDRVRRHAVEQTAMVELHTPPRHRRDAHAIEQAPRPWRLWGRSARAGPPASRSPSCCPTARPCKRSFRRTLSQAPCSTSKYKCF